MHHTEDHFTGVRGIRLYHQAWLPDGEARAALLVVHGIGEHSGRYAGLAERFAAGGYAVYALDHPGHGRSDGGREHIVRFEDFTDSLAIFHRLVAERQPDFPLFLLAHSLGGLIACRYLLDRPAGLCGTVLSAPGLRMGGSINPLAAAAARLLSAVAPRFGVAALDSRTISRDPDVVAAYLRDPLVFHGKTPARLAAETMKAMRRVADGADRITVPLLILQGDADRLVDPSGARLLHERAGSTDKTLRTYGGLWHELFNEPERETVIRDVEEWLSVRLPRAATPPGPTDGPRVR